MYAETFPVSFSMCDSSARLSLISALRLVQDAASGEMRRIGIDELTLIRRYGAIWVLRRNVLRFGAFPAWQTPVRITSVIPSDAIPYIAA